MRAGNNVGLLLVNRASPNPDVNDPTDIDKSAMEAEAWYVRLKQQFPNLYLGSSRPRKAWLRVARQPDGALEYTDSYALNDGRNDRNNLMCFAAFAWDFDAQGAASCVPFLRPPLKYRPLATPLLAGSVRRRHDNHVWVNTGAIAKAYRIFVAILPIV